MNSHDKIERAQRLSGSAARVGRWLLPLACVLVLSGSLAQAAEQALVRNPPVELLMTTESAATTARAGMLSRAGARWVLLASDGEVGSALVCLAASDRISADMLYV